MVPDVLRLARSAIAGGVIAASAPVASSDPLIDALARTYHVDSPEGADNIVIHGIGVEHRSAEAQGHSPFRETTARSEIWIGVAPSERSLLFEFRIGRHDGSERWRRRVIRGDTTVMVDYVDAASSVSASDASEATRRRLGRFLLHTLVREVYETGGPTQRLPDEEAVSAGRKSAVIRTTLRGERTPLELLIDTPSGQLVAARYNIEFPGIGPTRVTQEFRDQRRDSLLGWMPTRIVTRLDTAIYRELGIVRAERSRSLLDSLLAGTKLVQGAPAVAAGTAIGRPTRDTIITVAPGAHVLRAIGGLYNMFIVEQPDGLFVAEAPAIHPSLDEWPASPASDVLRLSTDAIRLISARFPGVPIRRVMPTHFHSDHAAGVAAFVDVGARIVAAPEDSAYFVGLCSRCRYTPAFDIVRDSASFGGGGNRLVIHTLRHGAHAANNSFVWLPRDRVVFQGDLFYVNPDGTLPESRLGVMREFVAFLDRRHIAPAIVWGMHGGRAAGSADLERVRHGDTGH